MRKLAARIGLHHYSAIESPPVAKSVSSQEPWQEVVVALASADSESEPLERYPAAGDVTTETLDSPLVEPSAGLQDYLAIVVVGREQPCARSFVAAASEPRLGHAKSLLAFASDKTFAAPPSSSHTDASAAESHQPVVASAPQDEILATTFVDIPEKTLPVVVVAALDIVFQRWILVAENT